ncbi:MAG: CPBP family intramembrane metalloprotease [Candidatus Aminicenantes bacterium]|nr:CPBP family intramembrane metalloprotease [Candidatus Aminicenantes bacterium]
MAAFYIEPDLKQTAKNTLFPTVIIPFVLACALFFPLFVFQNLGFLDFWWWMSVNIVLLVSFGFLIDSSYKDYLKRDFQSGSGKKIVLGILSAVILYGIFYAAGECSRIILHSAERNIDSIYGLKQGSSLLKIWLLMALVIGPGEELFWRGFLQRNWERRFGKYSGFLLCVLMYAFVHLGSGNPVLVLAAALCGLFWGGLFLWKKSVLLVAVSHAVWDVLIFLVFPL